MPEWLIGLISGGLFLTMLAWAFQWGKRGGNVGNRLKVLEKRADDPPIRPECSEIFTDIRKGLASLDNKAANLDGKMDVVLQVMRENQKNNEKKHIDGKEKNNE